MATVFRSRVIDRSEQLSGTLYNPMQSVDKKRRLIFELLQAVQNKMQDEMKTVKTQLKSKPMVKIEFDYTLINESGELLAAANTVLAFMDKKTGRPIKCPDYILEKLDD